MSTGAQITLIICLMLMVLLIKCKKKKITKNDLENAIIEKLLTKQN